MSPTLANKPLPNVPAWKRLGLKLKQPAAPHSAQEAQSSRLHFNTSGPDLNQNPKQKSYAPSSFATSKLTGSLNQQSKPPSLDPWNVDINSQCPTVSTELLKSDSDKRATRLKSSNKRKRTNESTGMPDVKIRTQTCLEYLGLWETSRRAWKFNKNHQNMLLQFAFDPSVIPSSHIDIFYRYIRGIKGAARQRLSETAERVRSENMEDSPRDSVGNLSDPRWDATVKPIPHDSSDKTSNHTEARFSFGENATISDVEGTEQGRRMVKRTRAEAILRELSSNGEAEHNDVTKTPAVYPAGEIGLGMQTLDGETDQGNDARSTSSKRAKLSDGTKQRISRRKRNLRVTEVCSSSSTASSGSDGESDECPDGKSDKVSSSPKKSNSRKGMNQPGGRRGDSSSGSSSSSSSHPATEEVPQ